MSNRTIVESAEAPKAIGPYSQAVRIQATSLLFTSGQIPLDPATGEIVPGGVREQAERVMQNLEALLRAGGTSFHNVVKTTIFLKDMNDFATVNEVYSRHFEGIEKPARSTVQVARLPRDVSVEIEMIAAVG
jgi:2-iminobutanoate/2-iminopropanoate deaminase